MGISFFIIALAMTVLATAVIARPLIVTSIRSDKGSAQVPLLAAVGVIVLAGALYFALGRPDATESSAHTATQAQTDRSSPAQPGKIGSVASMTDQLAERLKNEPDDAEGWLLLAKSYLYLGLNKEGLAAYKRAQALGKTDSDLEMSLLGVLLPGKKADGSSGDTPVSLRGRVALSPDAAASVEPGDTIFIFAKESPEHRMPVVALRKSATELPIDFVLTDAQAMVPGTTLASFQNLVVTARVSRTGLAGDVVDGLEVWSEPVSPVDGQRIDLTITTNSLVQGSIDE